jgi:hypothetical protein
MQAETLIADKAFDADARVIVPLATAGKTAVIRRRFGWLPPRRSVCLEDRSDCMFGLGRDMASHRISPD